MRKVEIELMTVTPLFLGGSDPRSGQPPELRPPSFRGAMRYWYRAALGGVVGDKNLGAVRALEEAVFGSTDSGSPISLRISGNLKWSSHPILPHKSAGRRNAFDAGQTFRLTMSARPTCPDLIWANACMALNLALTLGGVGLRSRRGMGSLQVVKSSDPQLVPVFPKNESEITKFIQIVVRSAVRQAQALAGEKGIAVTQLPEEPTEFPSAAMNAEIRLLSQINARNGVEAVADLMRRFPKQNWLGGISPRQASPVWARVFKTTEGYHLLFTLLPAKLAGDTHDYTELRRWLKMGNVVGVKGWNQ
uniref:Type III-B CRISPR module RAMP protein Cmr1 n=1 Tax=Bellilinea caldifistulae TaxID=360411 RepID=A0A7C4Q2K9_9CHLR